MRIYILAQFTKRRVVGGLSDVSVFLEIVHIFFYLRFILEF